jgi:hypothetical protein
VVLLPYHAFGVTFFIYRVPLPTAQELLQLEHDRQQASDWVLERLQLLPTLQRYGTPYLVGAKALGLMVARDIDLSLVVTESLAERWQQLVAELMLTPHVRKVTAIDYYNYDHHQHYTPAQGQHYSYYISMDKLHGPDDDPSHLWECQIHLQMPTSFDATRVAQIRRQMTRETRVLILRLKYWADGLNGLLKCRSQNTFKLPSVAIYTAVLEAGVQTIPAFIAYFRQHVPPYYQQLYEETVSNTYDPR